MSTARDARIALQRKVRCGRCQLEVPYPQARRLVIEQDDERVDLIVVYRCALCSEQSLCSANWQGVHEVVFTPEDPSHDFVLHEKRAEERGLVLDRATVPFDDGQWGYCKCGQPVISNHVYDWWEDLTWEMIAEEWSRRSSVGSSSSPSASPSP